MTRILLSVFMVVASASSALAQAEEKETPKITLRVGDKAPALQPGKWIQGEPVTAFEPGKVYVVEFWATWCAPCRPAIPHLSAIQEKHKDKGVIVIGQSIWERGENADEAVAKLVQKMGEKMTYRVAVDDRSEEGPGKMASTWMAAAGLQGIPSAFVVDRTGTIAWIGHPGGNLDSVLDQVLAGTLVPAKAPAAVDEAQKKEDAAGRR